MRLRDIPQAANPSLTLQQYIPPPPSIVGDAPPVDVPLPPPAPAYIAYDGSTYTMRSVHFHAGASEHTVDDSTGLLEMHFVFERTARPRTAPPPVLAPSPLVSEGQDGGAKAENVAERMFTSVSDTGATSTSEPIIALASSSESVPAVSPSTPPPPQTLVLAVIGTKAKESGPWLSGLLSAFVAKAGEDGRGPGIVTDSDLSSVLPDLSTAEFYMYSGSLTTPPCTEGILWIVSAENCPVSETDVATIANLQGGPNVRGVQERNDRVVRRFPHVTVAPEATNNTTV